jgi:SSS family solute:Na+ symporter
MMMPILAVFGPLDWGVVIAYFALMIYMGVFAARRDQGAREYFLGDRSLPSWALAISIVATTLSAATFVGGPELSYGGNLTYLLLPFTSLIAVLIVAIWFVPKLYGAGTVTIYGYLGGRYGQTARIAVSAMFLFGRTLASGARLFIAAIPLCLLMFAAKGQADFQAKKWQLMVAVGLIGLIGTFYTTLGGIKTIVWIDVIQFIIVVGAALVSIGLMLHAIPLSPLGIVRLLAHSPGPIAGHSKLQMLDFSRDPNKPFTIWAALIGNVFLGVAVFGVDQDFAQRFLISKSAVKGSLSLLYSQLIGIVVVGFFLLIGLLLYIFYKRPDVMGAAAPRLAPGNQQAYAAFLLNELPTVVSGLALAGFFAIAQGSMDSAINALASSLVADIYYPYRAAIGRPIDAKRDAEAPKLAVAIMGLVMVLFAVGCIAIYNGSSLTLIEFALGIMAFAYAGMLGVFLTALFTPRGNTASVLAALLAGIATVTLLQPGLLERWSRGISGHSWHVAGTWWMPIGTAVSFLVCVAGRPQRGHEPLAAMRAAPAAA